MNCKIFHRITLVLSFFIFFQSCHSSSKKSEQQGEIKAEDSRGKIVSLPQEAKRVIVLFEPSLDEIYMLHAEDKVVGIPQQVFQNEDKFEFYAKLDERIKNKTIATPTFGGGSSNIETIVGLQPDLAIVYEQNIETIQQLEELNIPVFTVSSLSQDKIYKELLGMGTLLGKKQRAEEVVSYVKAEAEKLKTPVNEKPKKVYYAWSKGRIFSTSGKGTLLDLAIKLSGAENACPLEMESPNVGAESIYKWNPDLIVLWNSSLDEVYQLKELDALPAVKSKQVFAMNPAFYYDPHTVKFLLFAKQLRNWCYPSAYSTEQLNKEVQNDIMQLYQKPDLYKKNAI
ncbi:ABC transporter substrate-binding protein [Empedobacter falsenii]|uniref:ABC transporter substrate-binding protein n=1 Tax=Empedobacter sp. GD03797 TaxID=2975382 RepID=UPI002448D21B|nr:ABC transporter substrate-binding protein [Empedobacter sp. GD03797]MDH1882831.1 ABC transporter substrate-binding protein [Empedobacter sp. GD03797]